MSWCCFSNFQNFHRLWANSICKADLSLIWPRESPFPFWNFFWHPTWAVRSSKNLGSTRALFLISGIFRYAYYVGLCVWKCTHRMHTYTHSQRLADDLLSRLVQLMSLVTSWTCVVSLRHCRYCFAELIHRVKVVTVVWGWGWCVCPCLCFNLYLMRSCFNSRFIRIIRLLRFLKVLKIFKILRTLFRLRNYQIDLSKCAFFVCMLAHLAGCIWWFLKTSLIDAEQLAQFKAEENVQTPIISSYIVAIYFLMCTLCTVGYGDISATGDNERIFIIFAMIIGASMFAIVIRRMRA